MASTSGRRPAGPARGPGAGSPAATSRERRPAAPRRESGPRPAAPERLAAAAPGLRVRRSPLGDPRGLTALGAVVLVVVLGSVAGAVDVLTGAGLRLVFALGFPLACAAAALAVHREDLRAAVVMPPLLYCGLALLAGAVEGRSAAGGWLQQQAVELASALVYQAPVLFAATGLAVLVALLRSRA